MCAWLDFDKLYRIKKQHATANNRGGQGGACAAASAHCCCSSLQVTHITPPSPAVGAPTWMPGSYFQQRYRQPLPQVVQALPAARYARRAVAALQRCPGTRLLQRRLPAAEALQQPDVALTQACVLLHLRRQDAEPAVSFVSLCTQTL